MYNSKIASLEARIARLESRLTKRSSNPTFEKEYLEHLEKYLSSYFEDTGRFQFWFPNIPYPQKL